MALKLLSVDARRPRDAQDLAVLVAVANQLEIDRCRNAIARITARGFHRGRDLDAALDQLIRG